MLIQFILIIVIIFIVLRLIYKLKAKEINLSQFFSWLVIWLSAICIIWYPQITTYLAARVGIGRGVDLVIYVSIIVIFYFMFRLLLKIEQIEKQITKIVRHDSLKDIISHEDKK